MFEMAQIRHALNVEKQAARELSWRVLIATPGNRKRMRLVVALAIFSQWRSVVAWLRHRSHSDVDWPRSQWEWARFVLHQLDLGG